MMMINSPSDGGELNFLNSVGVRVSSKVKIPLKNKVNFINTTNRFCPRHSFSKFQLL